MQILSENDMIRVNTQLHTLIKERKNEEAISLIKSIEPDSLFYHGSYLLHHTVEYDNLVMAKYFIDNGWDLFAENLSGELLLDVADNRGKADMIAMLCSRLFNEIEKNSIIDERIKLTKTRWPNDLKCVRILLKNMTRDCYNKKEISEKLLQLNCPLAAAVHVFNDAEFTKVMLDGGCPVDSRLVSTGETALHFAVEYFDVDNVRLLLNYGAEVDALDEMNSTPLSRFKIHPTNPDKSLQILKLMIDRGASLTVTCSTGRSVDWYSHEPKKTIMNKLLLEGDMQILRMINPYIDLCHRDTVDRTPLHHLVKNENRNSLEILKGKNVNVNILDNTGWSPLDMAVSIACYEKVRFLLEHGASPNNVYHQIDMAVSQLLCRGNNEGAKNVFELLLFYDVDLELLARNHHTSSILQCAMATYFDFAKLILAHLARLESLGVFPNTFFSEIIKSSKDLQDYSYSCKRQIEKMKVTSVYESITLYKLLTESQKKLVTYARNEEFQLHYESLENNEVSINSHYAKSIKYRIDKAIVIARMKNEAACIICQITGFPESMVGTLGYIIIDYLNQNDIENVIKIFEDCSEN